MADTPDLPPRDSMVAGAPNLWGQLYIALRYAGNTHQACMDAASDGVSVYGDEPATLADAVGIAAQLTEGGA